jgi:hypothetical protein
MALALYLELGDLVRLFSTPSKTPVYSNVFLKSTSLTEVANGIFQLSAEILGGVGALALVRR